MKAIGKLMWLYMTAYATQRYIAVGAFGLSALIGIPAVLLTSPRAQGEWFAVIALLLIPVVIALVPAMLAAGSVVRFLASQRSSRLLPRVRLKLLLSTIVLTLVVTTVFGTLIVVPAISAGEPAAAEILLMIFSISSVLIYFVYRLTSLSPWFFLELLAFIALATSVLPAAAATQLDGAIAVYVSFGLVLLGWLVFSGWFLSGRPIRPVDLAGQNARLVERVSVPLRPGRFRAATTLLLRRYSGAWPRELGLGALVAGALIAVIAAVRALTAEARPFPLEMIVLAGTLVIGLNLIQISRRARYLWLLEPSRDGVFALVERVTMSIWVRAAVFSTLFTAGSHALIDPVGPARLAGLAGLLCGTMVLGSYLSLALSDRLTQAIVAWAIMLIGSVLLALALLTGYFSVGTVMIIAAAELVVAVPLRVLARHRWRAADWTAHKPFEWGKATAT